MNERANPSQNEIWRHFKGGEYKIFVTQETETGENIVVYKALCKEHKVFARPLSMPIDMGVKATKQIQQERLNGTHRS